DGTQGDPELVAIFLEEAHDILESAGRSLDTWITDTGNSLEIQSLQRDLHTLKGGARMAEVQPLGDLGHELETLYEALALDRLPVQPVLFDLLHRCHDRLAEMVDQLGAGQPLTGGDDLITALHDYLRDPGAFTLPAASAEPAPSQPAGADAEPDTPLPDEVDLEILDVFLEEAEELCEIIDGCLVSWRDHPESRDFSDDLKRALHTLKGGARLSGLNELGEMSHRFETLMHNLESQRRDPDENDFQAMTAEFDALNERLVELRRAAAAQPLPAQPPATRETRPEASAQPGVKREERRPQSQPQEMVRVGADVLEALVNLAGETSINRGRVEQSISEFGFNIG
ncbi:MAG TPA: hybrid sensor histidine kinase/response regulator, partial [Alcanivorax sp.]|nr:hybrid sensor histidine kinase/response regulator [Alcanivorax sp.]